jgi:hypothetical protein
VKKLLALLAIAFAAVLIYGAFQPGEFHVQRTVTIQASADKIFPLINDFHNWPSWSPYEKLDPTMKHAISGAASGQGAVYEWSGNAKAGRGRMLIAQSVAPSKVAIKLDFSEPMEGHDLAEFTLQPIGNSTEVTWGMSGPLNYVSKVMTIFVSMDKLVGKDFAAGLNQLKAVAEK